MLESLTFAFDSAVVTGFDVEESDLVTHRHLVLVQIASLNSA